MYKQFKEQLKDEFKSCKNLESELATKFWQLSGKLRVLMHFLTTWKSDGIQNKVLIFS
jgi:hypothetical protein